MFLQLEHNVPDVYVEKSRDFQLICRVLNIVLNAAIERCSGMLDNLDVDTIDENLLYLMARKQGFVSNHYFPPKVLKNIIEVFPDIIRKKGTEEAIREAVYAVISAGQDIQELTVSYNSEGNIITILTDAGDDYLEYISCLLDFIIPAGIRWKYSPNLRRVTQYQDDTASSALIIRFRGIGDVISHIIHDKSDLLLEVEKATQRGIDWGELENSYKLDNWNGALKDLKELSVSPFYSKVNVAKIVRSKPVESKLGIDEKE